jgi:hypothetical protein
MDNTALRLLLSVVIPLWIVAGFADYLCHRAARIELNAGLRESVLHAVQFVEVGSALLAALLLDINGAVIVFCLAMLALHEVTAYIDIRYAGGQRRIEPVEQMIHSFLELLPLAAILLLVASRWPQLASWAETRAALGDFVVRVDPHPLPVQYVVTLVAGIVLLGIVPYIEELWRCARAARR